MKHEMTQWKCFVQTHLLFVTICGLARNSSVTFKDDTDAPQCVIGYATSLYLIMGSRRKPESEWQKII